MYPNFQFNWLSGIKILTCKFLIFFFRYTPEKEQDLSVITKYKIQKNLTYNAQHNFCWHHHSEVLQKLRTKLSMNGVPFRFSRQKNSTWIPAKLVLTEHQFNRDKIEPIWSPKIRRTFPVLRPAHWHHQRILLIPAQSFWSTRIFHNFVHRTLSSRPTY